MDSQGTSHKKYLLLTRVIGTQPQVVKGRNECTKQVD